MLGPVSLGSPQDIETALKLVKLLADPEAASALLEELRAAEKAANAVIREANEQSAAVGKRERDSVSLLESAAQMEKSARAEAARVRSRIENEALALDRAKKALEDATRTFEVEQIAQKAEREKREREISDTNATLEQERAIALEAIAKSRSDADDALRSAAEIEAAAKKVFDEATALRVDYESKLSALRQLTK